MEPTADILGERILKALTEEFSAEQNFPTSLDAAMLIRDTLKDPETTLEKAAQAVSMEPLVAAKVIRLSNSVVFNRSGQTISDITTAVSRLGFEMVRTLALAVALDQMLQGTLCNTYSQYSQQAWERAIQTAAIARVLARRIGRINPDEALLAGIVSQIGVFYILYRTESESACRDNPKLLFDLIRQWHPRVGDAVLARLEIPQAIREALAPSPATACHVTPNTLHDLILIADMLNNAVCAWLDPAAEDSRLPDERKRFADLIADAEEDILDVYMSLNA